MRRSYRNVGGYRVGFSGPMRKFARKFPRWKPGLLTTNHCENSISSTAGTEIQTAVFSCVSGPTNRGLHIPEGATLTKVVIKLMASDDTPVQGKHQCFLVKRPGATVFTTGPITNWYLTTDPATEEMIDVRRYAMIRKPYTNFIIAGQAVGNRCTMIWRGKWIMRDGDDVIVATLSTNLTQYYAECHATYVM